MMPPWQARRCDCLCRGDQRLGLGKAGDDDRCSRGDRFGAPHDLYAGPGQLPAFACVDVETNHAPTGFDEIARERAAHDAEPDHAHRPV